MKNASSLFVSSDEAFHHPNGASGRNTVHDQNQPLAKPLILFILYFERKTPDFSNEQRDRVIRKRYTEGEAVSDLARAYQLSPQRIFQIVHNLL